MGARAPYEPKRPNPSPAPDERAWKRIYMDGGRTGYVDALNDIKDEIAFAFKCIERSAGEEASIHPIRLGSAGGLS